jgi:mono/diheme cytochrome c family protein
LGTCFPGGQTPDHGAVFNIEKELSAQMKSVTTAILLALLAFPSALAWGQGDEAAGKGLFMNQCSVCHGADASGKTAMAKSLGATIQDFRSKQVQSLTDLDIRRVITEGKGIMPPLGDLGTGNFTNLIAYIRSFSANQAEESVAQGSPQRGEQLFTGEVHFRNRGPACISCHTIAGLSFHDGGTLGPDLTHAYAKLGPRGTEAAMQTLYFGVMTPIYSEHPVVPQEQADLIALLMQSEAKPQTRWSTQILILIAFLLGGVFVALTGFLWRDRVRSVRRALVDKARRQGVQS